MSMSEQSNIIYSEKAAKKLRSADDLDKYLHMTSPRTWIVLTACAALILGLLAWGIFGAVTTSISATGVRVGGQAICFLSEDDAANVQPGDPAKLSDVEMTVSKVSSIPVSREEAKQILISDYLTESLLTDDWAYMVEFEGNVSALPESVPLRASITTERVAPITLLTGGKD